MKYNLLNQEVEFSQGILNYNTIFQSFTALAETLSDEYEKIYDSENRDLDQLIKRGENQYIRIISKAISQVIQLLIDKGIYTFDEYKLMELYLDKVDEWSVVFNTIEEKYATIVFDNKQIEQYRKNRKSSRGRIVGGGFGLSGAAKGIATASVLNMASGAGHSIFNGIGNMISSAKANNQKRELFRNKSTFRDLKHGVYKTIWNLHFIFIHIIKENFPSIDIDIVDHERVKQAKLIMKNIQNHNPDISVKRKLLIDVLKLDPYNFKTYETIFNEFGDRDKALDRIAKVFNVKEFLQYKKELINKFITENTFSTSEEGKNVKCNLLKFAEKYSLDVDNSTLDKIDQKIAKLQIEELTVDGILFNTKYEADIARKEFSLISKNIHNIEKCNFEELKILREVVMSLTSEELIDKYKQCILKQYEKAELERRTVSIDELNTKIIYETFEEVLLAREHITNIKEFLDTFTYVEGMMLEDIKTQLFSKYNDKVVEAFLPVIEKKYLDNQKKFRTVLGVMCSTDEEANKFNTIVNDYRVKISSSKNNKRVLKLKKDIRELNLNDNLKNILHKMIDDEIINRKRNKMIGINVTFLMGLKLIFWIIVIGSRFIELYYNSNLANKELIMFGETLINQNYNTTIQQLGFKEGIINGLLVFGKIFSDIFINGSLGFINGFKYDLIGNALWLFFGWIWTFLKETLLFFPKYFVNLFYIFIQKASVSYYIGYVVATAFTWLLLSVQDSEKN